jgi:hypothetical protein
MIAIRTSLPKHATGAKPAGIGMRHGFDMQVRGKLPVSGIRLAP